MADERPNGLRRGGWQKGQSGNPGGRPKIAQQRAHLEEALKGIDVTPAEARARVLSLLWVTLFDPATDKEGATWRYCMGEMLTLLQVREEFRISMAVTAITPEMAQLIEAIKMTPHARRAALAQDSTDPADVVDVEGDDADT